MKKRLRALQNAVDQLLDAFEGLSADDTITECHISQLDELRSAAELSHEDEAEEDYE